MTLASWMSTHGGTPGTPETKLSWVELTHFPQPLTTPPSVSEEREDTDRHS